MKPCAPPVLIPPESQSSDPVASIMAVIVLYRTPPRASTTVRTLVAARGFAASSNLRIQAILWDNSPTPHANDGLPGWITYIHDPRNLGLVHAYNRAIEMAIERRSTWLLTLDQDTGLPQNYFAEMVSALQQANRHAGIAAIVPHIRAGAKTVSPNWFVGGAWPRWYPPSYSGISSRPTFAFNSGSLLRVDSLLQIGGYSPWFWLDNSDSYLFHSLHKFGKRVFVAGVQLHHDFSMLHLAQEMAPRRYAGVLLSEMAFWDLHMNRPGRIERILRLFVRLARLGNRAETRAIRDLTAKAIRTRLFTPRSARLQMWKQATAQRLGPALEESALSARPPKISVCMAAYNGEKFIDAQLRSILPQLGDADEVVIVDDASRDQTVERIKRFHDPRIRLYQREQNKGIIAGFEDALRMASGDILFLCDDDDLWAPDKVQRFLETFERNPDAQIVLSRVKLIDENGREFQNPHYDRRGKFIPGFWHNILRNHYQGSAMAIRASLLGNVLPFPRRRTVMYDAWIGTRCSALGGKTIFIADDLLLYRRHAANISRSRSLLGRIYARFELVLAHITHAVQLESS